MEVVLGISIAVCVLYLIIAFAVCFKFASIAEMKGHDKDTHFWWCFWCGLFGMLAVIALPDRNKPKSYSYSQEPRRTQHTLNDDLPDL